MPSVPFSRLLARVPSPPLLGVLPLRRPVISGELLVVLVSVMFTLLYNGAFWQGVVSAQQLDWLHWFGYGVLVTGIQAFFMLLIAVPGGVKPVLMVLAATAAAVSYFTGHYGTYFDAEMIDNLVQTDPREAAELLTAGFVRHVLLFGAVPAVLVWPVEMPRVRWRRALVRRLAWLAATLAMVILALLLSYQSFSSLMRNDRSLRHLVTPGNVIAAGLRNLARAEPTPTRPIPVGEDARLIPHGGDKPLLLVLVVGETVRADHWGLNGYPRQTTPKLAHRDLVNFPQVSSCGTSTAVSVPCMFSSTGKDNYDKHYVASHESLLDVLHHAGMEVTWIDNQGGCKGVCRGVEYRHVLAADHPAECSDGVCRDQVLVSELARQLARDAKNAARDRVLVLHQMGNHGPSYFQRYPDTFRKFIPTCDDADLNRCSRDQIVNSYDNAILYTDTVLDGVIEVLARQSTYAASLLYLSDHGESLGERGLYLHGLPYAIAPEQQTRVPMVWWSSRDFDRETALDKSCLREASSQPLSHDNLFDTVLGVLGVATATYRPQLDVSAAARHAQSGCQGMARAASPLAIARELSDA